MLPKNIFSTLKNRNVLRYKFQIFQTNNFRNLWQASKVIFYNNEVMRKECYNRGKCGINPESQGRFSVSEFFLKIIFANTPLHIFLAKEITLVLLFFLSKNIKTIKIIK